jgi:hypothetical protein
MSTAEERRAAAEERRAAAAERQAAARERAEARRAEREADADRARDYKHYKGVIKDAAPLVDSVGRLVGAFKGFGGTMDQAEGTREAAGHRAMGAAEMARQRREAIEQGDVSGYTGEREPTERGGRGGRDASRRDANSARGGTARPSAAEQLVEAVAEARRSGKQSDIDRAVDIAGRMRDSNGNYSIPRQTIYVPREVGDGSEPRFSGGAKANSPEALVEAVSRGIKGVPGHEITFQRDRAAQPVQSPASPTAAPAEPSQGGYVKTALHVDGAPAPEKQTLPSLEQVVRGVAAAKVRGEFGPEEREAVKRTLQLIEQQNGGIDFPDHNQRVSRQPGMNRAEFNAASRAVAENNRGMDTGQVPAGATDTAKVRFSGTQHATADAALTIIENTLDKAGIGKKVEVAKAQDAPAAPAPAAPAQPTPAVHKDEAPKPAAKEFTPMAIPTADLKAPMAKSYSGLTRDQMPDGLRETQVKGMQDMLKAAGFDLGKHGADGKCGKDTVEALKAACKAAGIADYKKVNFADPADAELVQLQAHLNKVAKEAAQAKDAPQAAPAAPAPVLEASAPEPQRVEVASRRMTDEEKAAYDAQQASEAPVRTASVASGMTLAQSLAAQQQEMLNPLGTFNQPPAAEPATAVAAAPATQAGTFTSPEGASTPAELIARAKEFNAQLDAANKAIEQKLADLGQAPAAEPAPAVVAAPAAAPAPAPEPQPVMVAAAFANAANAPAFAAMPAMAAAARNELFSFGFGSTEALPTPAGMQQAVAQAQEAIRSQAPANEAVFRPDRLPDARTDEQKAARAGGVNI